MALRRALLLSDEFRTLSSRNATYYSLPSAGHRLECAPAPGPDSQKHKLRMSIKMNQTTEQPSPAYPRPRFPLLPVLTWGTFSGHRAVRTASVTDVGVGIAVSSGTAAIVNKKNLTHSRHISRLFGRATIYPLLLPTCQLSI